jgi:glycine cleavage system H protein
MADVKDGLKYTENDEWIRVEGNAGFVGITDYAQDALNDIVYVELPDVDDEFGKGDSFGVVESVKAASDMHMPVGGKVLEVNSALEDSPETVNSDPYGDGWFVKIEIADAAELDGLMDAAAYTKFLADRD